MAATLWVALGGALGSIGRYWLGVLMENISKTLPWGTIIINIGGSFIIAFFAALALSNSRIAISQNIYLFVSVGLCGGFTTFSSFSLQTLTLIRDGAVMRAFLNIALSVFLCLVAAAFGWLVGERFNGSSVDKTVMVDDSKMN